MNQSSLECNVEEVFSQFMDLTAKELNTTVRRALRAGGKELQKQTRKNAKAGIKTRNNPHYNKSGQLITYDDKIEDAVRLSKIDGDFGSELNQKVHVYGSRAEHSGTYRFRFLEKGTKQRYAKYYRDKNGKRMALKKQRYLGRIQGRWFFKNAQSQVFPNLEKIYMNEIDKTIQKLNQVKI